jgi:hypothetical protein
MPQTSAHARWQAGHATARQFGRRYVDDFANFVPAICVAGRFCSARAVFAGYLSVKHGGLVDRTDGFQTSRRSDRVVWIVAREFLCRMAMRCAYRSANPILFVANLFMANHSLHIGAEFAL